MLPLYSHPSFVGLISGTSADSLVPRPEEKTRLLLASFPGPAQLSVAFLYSVCWAGHGNEATVSRDYLSNLSFLLGLPVCVLFALMFQQCGALCHVRFYVSFSPPLFAAGSFAGHFENKMVHFENTMVPYQLPLDLRWAVRLPRNSYTCIFKIFTTLVLLFNEYECIYGTTYEYISTYRHRLRSTR